jgi:S1-C subfamily serine protease
MKIRMIFKRTLALLAAVIIIAANTVQAAASSGNVISDARESVVRVLTPDGGGGTAFVIAQSGSITHLVTNLHVVSGFSEVMIIPDNIEGSWIKASVMFLPDGLDLAILTTTTGLANRPVLPLAKASTVNAADTVYALGFPGSADEFFLVDEGHRLPSSTEDVTTTRGVISRTNVSMSQGTQAFQLDVNISWGNSGGPLLNEKGQVIGVNTWGNFEGAALMTYAIHIDYIIRECESRGIPYVAAKSGLSDTALILIAAGAVVVLIVAAVAIIMAGKKKKPVPVAANSAAVGAMQAAPIPVQPSVRACIRAAGGQFAGRSFDVKGRLIIGRDAAKCTVAFPVDSAGISGVHCEIYLEGSTAYLRDLGSSYGTFLSNGTKLPAKAPQRLNNGDRFYVADEQNTFEFSMM